MAKQPESLVLNAICQYLTIQQAQRKCFFWRQNNVSIYDFRNKCYRKFPTHCIKGVADIQILLPSRTVFVEVKAAKGTQRKEQKEFEIGVVAMGCEYYICRSIDDVIAAMEGQEAFKKRMEAMKNKKRGKRKRRKQ